MIKPLKFLNNLGGKCFGMCPVTGVPGGLAAAGLPGWDLDCAARILQQFDRGKTHRGSEHVDEAGDKQGDAGSGHGISFGSRLCRNITLVVRTTRTQAGQFGLHFLPQVV